MPEGPSIMILKESVNQFAGHKVIGASGNSEIDIKRLNNKIVISFKSWGKHFLICFEDFTVKVHLLMFGTYLINEKKEAVPKLNLTFSNGEINLYTCSIKILEGDINAHYDWTGDVMNENWNPKIALEKLKKIPKQMICDALLNQDIFAGVGNIIKNEILYRTYIHPESLIGKIPSLKLKEVIKECSKYSFEFLKLKKNNELSHHWLAYTKKVCLRCNLPIHHEQTGKKKRKSYYCENCQKLYL